MKLYEPNRKYGSLAVVIPKSLTKAFGWSKGDHLDYCLDKNLSLRLFKRQQP